jgi:hypothetical protein
MERINTIRVKIAEDTVTDEELQEAVALLRADRRTAEPIERAKKAKVAVPDSATLMSILGKLNEAKKTS